MKMFKICEKIHSISHESMTDLAQTSVVDLTLNLTIGLIIHNISKILVNFLNFRTNYNSHMGKADIDWINICYRLFFHFLVRYN